jgi:uncharacterized protein YcaQ
VRIALSTARRLAIRAQGLDGRWQLAKGKEGVAQAVERLGYVQIDTIAVVRRAHHHTLWSRRRDYQPDMLHELQANDRGVFEYWCPAASYLPMSDYRYYLPTMRGIASSPKTRAWLADRAGLVDGIVKRIRREGPLTSADFAAPEGRKRGPWWDWKPAKQVLERLFSMGELMIAERRNFQRVYDLAERVLPSDANTEPPSDGERARFVVERALGGRGVASLKEMRWAWIADRAAVSQALADMLESGEVTAVEIRGLDGGPYYALTETLDRAAARGRGKKQLHILSPFDSLVADRRRVRALFDFDCKLECYFPEAKRRHGYFCLPILWGDRFVGRLDPKADRKQKTLIVHKLMFERGFKDYEPLLPALAEKLHAFAAFNQCERVTVTETQPRKLRAPLRRALRDAPQPPGAAALRTRPAAPPP